MGNDDGDVFIRPFRFTSSTFQFSIQFMLMYFVIILYRIYCYERNVQMRKFSDCYNIVSELSDMALRCDHLKI